MANFLTRQVDRIVEYLRSHPRLLAWSERTLPEVEKFVIAGPTLVGYLVGLLRYNPGSLHFEIGFQSLVVFVAYLTALVVAQVLDSLLFTSWPMVLGIARSLLALCYLWVTMRQYIQWRRKAPRIFPFAERMRQRLRFIVGDAA